MSEEHNLFFIDFDHVSKIWRLNKKYLGKGNFIYKCNHVSTITGKYCSNKLANSLFCKFHCKIENIKQIKNI
jgi:hypothetical protein